MIMQASKNEGFYKDHHLHGPLQAEQILNGLGYPQEKTEAVKHCIGVHRASVRGKKRSAEAECLANADAMAHLEQVPSLLHLAYVQHGFEIDAGSAWVMKKLERSWKKLAPKVRQQMKTKYKAALKTLTIS